MVPDKRLQRKPLMDTQQELSQLPEVGHNQAIDHIKQLHYYMELPVH